MCQDNRPNTVAFHQSNWENPNLLVRGPSGIWDMTATFARIEAQYGSRTQCDEREAARRRARKEKLKLTCVCYAISGWQEGEDNETPLHWLMPQSPALYMDYYKAFSDSNWKEEDPL